MVRELLVENPTDSYSQLVEDGLINNQKDVGERPLPPWPTQSLPGTIMKIEVMAWRYRNGFQLHHPDDARGALSPAQRLLADMDVVRGEDNYPIHPHDVKPQVTLLESLRREGTNGNS